VEAAQTWVVSAQLRKNPARIPRAGMAIRDRRVLKVEGISSILFLKGLETFQNFSTLLELNDCKKTKPLCIPGPKPLFREARIIPKYYFFPSFCLRQTHFSTEFWEEEKKVCFPL
jgi:hypothetical protein